MTTNEQAYLEKLNEQQRAAVEYCDGPQLVIAGAGSGKTRVLTYKIVHLLHQGYEPWRIMALTFTNKAAREMRERIEPLAGPDVAAQLWMGTFHSIFSRLLRRNAELIGFKPDFTIYDQSDSRSLIKLIVKDMGLDDKVYKPASIQTQISNAKNALISPEDYARNQALIDADRDAQRPETAAIYKAYWNRCRIAGAMDFDDLLFYTNLLLRDNPDVLERYQEFFRYILVDEYQDTNFSQHLIVHQLSKKYNRLCVVGDDAQSIYSFRGANIENILRLQRFYPDIKTFKLERNYRSTQTITDAANSLIEKNKGQIRKHLFSKNQVGDRIPVIRCFSDYEEAYVVANQIAALKARQGDSYEDYAVLYRTNAQSRVLEEALSNGGRRDKHGNMRSAIPYRIYGGLSFYQRKEVKDAICYFRLVINPDDDEALRRVINYPSRGIGDTTVGKMTHCASESGVSLWQVMNHAEQYGLNVNRGTLTKLERFAALLNGLIELNQSGKDAMTVAQETIRRTKLKSVLMGDNTPENISRIENLDELINAVNDFQQVKEESGDEHCQIGDFLAETSLLTDQDMNDPDGEKVTLMTVHAAKGLEFRNVIIVGVEEDLFPSAMSADSLAKIEEERRLLYVAITRAEENCIITYATSRYHNGQTKSCVMSRFLRDLDPDFLLMGSTNSAPVPSRERTRYRTEAEHRSTRTTRTERTTTPTRPKPAPKPLSPSPTATPTPHVSSPSPTPPPAAGSGNFTIHTIEELSVRCEILHQRFGRGTVTNIDTSGDAKIDVAFHDGQTRKLLLKFAKFEIL
ncbi:MAG: UvrD-helicase domain-containing protein [Muribaculaceae bacterium]|nr:UvrD-helicase domain-containing protein [Muribaculaceae bacterium]